MELTAYLLPEGRGLLGGQPKNKGTLRVAFKGASVDGVHVNGILYPVVRGSASIPTDGLDGVVALTAYNSITRRSYDCGSIHVLPDLIAPLPAFTPAEYAAMAVEAKEKADRLEEKVKILWEAVYGAPLFGKEE